jgi:hypothetical protein
VARAFRKPAFLESGLHVLGDIPADSPFYGSEQEFFEFMTRVIGNRDLDNEKVLAVEAGYLGRFFAGALTVSLDLYFNQYADIIEMDQNLVPDPIRVIDLDRTSFQFENTGKSLDIAGGELGVRWAVGRNLVLQGAWAYRQVYDHDTGRAKDNNPKNMFTLGGRFTTDGGLVGSLFGFTRSEFWDRSVENPAGLLAPALQVHMGNVLLLLGRLGYRLMLGEGVLLEAGVKLFLPLPRYWDKGGTWTTTGTSFGGDLLGRSVLGYLQGSY